MVFLRNQKRQRIVHHSGNGFIHAFGLLCPIDDVDEHQVILFDDILPTGALRDAILPFRHVKGAGGIEGQDGIEILLGCRDDLIVAEADLGKFPGAAELFPGDCIGILTNTRIAATSHND